MARQTVLIAGTAGSRPGSRRFEACDRWASRVSSRGSVFLLGDGRNAINPIHGADLADFCVNKLTEKSGFLELGGPETLTTEEIAELAFRALEQPSRITRVPLRLASVGMLLYRLVNPKRADLGRFFVRSSSLDFQAPTYGLHRLADYFKQLR